MVKKHQNFVAVFLLLVATLVPVHEAHALLIIDAANLSQNSIKSAKTIKDFGLSYALKWANGKIKDIDEDQSEAIWGVIDKAIDSLILSKTKFDQLQINPSTMHSYLQKFELATSLEFQQCLANARCPREQLHALRTRMQDLAQARNAIYQNATKDAEKKQAHARTDIKTLRLLQQRARDAKGRMAAINYANEYAAEHCRQMLHIRSAFAQISQTMAAEIQAEVEFEQQQRASARAIRSARVAKSKPAYW